jgi:hypothetical protein
MRPAKKVLNQYPPHGAKVSAYDFVMDPDCGLPDIVKYLNLWASEAERVENLLIVRYEDMRSDPKETLRRVMEFIDDQAPDGEPRTVSQDAIDQAVEYSSVENMRKLEEKSVFWLSGSRMRPGKKGDPNTYKVRRAKVDGYKDYFNEVEAGEIDRLVSQELSPTYGYDAPAATYPAAPS